MFKLSEDTPDNVVGVMASGEITAKDYKATFIPAIERTLQRHGSVRILYQMGSPAFRRALCGTK